MLRRLEEKDAEFMLEWMHNTNINSIFNADFSKTDIGSAIKFIKNSFSEENQHFAIVDENDEYLGTISLKNISLENRNAEYAIVTREKIHSKGIAKSATEEIINYAFQKLKLNKLYLYVLEGNMRAVKFYEKFGFSREGVFIEHVYKNEKYHNLIWYAIFNPELV